MPTLYSSSRETAAAGQATDAGTIVCHFLAEWVKVDAAVAMSPIQQIAIRAAVAHTIG
jgi:hypothetical protein